MYSPTVISINFVPNGIQPDMLFLSNSKRYLQLATKLNKEKHRIIATSNVSETTTGAFEFKLNYSSLIDTSAEFIDHSMIMLMKVLIDCGVKKISLAAFDGYSAKNTNYYKRAMEYDFVKKKADYLNTYTKEFLQSVNNKVEVEFVTTSHYEDKEI